MLPVSFPGVKLYEEPCSLLNEFLCVGFCTLKGVSQVAPTILVGPRFLCNMGLFLRSGELMGFTVWLV